MIVRAFELPEPPARIGRARFGEAELEVVELDARELVAIVRGLIAPGGDVGTRVDGIARAARRFADPADAIRRAAEEWLPPTTGFSRAMIAETLPSIFAAIEANALVSAVAAAGPLAGKLAIVAAGNVPGVAIAKTALALAAGVPCLVKTASGEPLLSVLFADALAEEHPRFAEAHVALWWDGGRADLADALGREIEALVAYGSDRAIADLRRIAPSIFVGHGHRLSVAAIQLGSGSIRELARAAARDVALYDQQGCLSPQAIFTLGGDREAAVDLLEALGHALADLAEKLPRGRVSEAEHLAIRRYRDEAEWRAIRGEGVRIRQDARGTEWTVVLDPEPRLRANPLFRTIVVHPLASAADLAPVLAPLAGRIESIGVAPWPDEELRRVTAALRIPRVVPLGTMQAPDLAWRQGGRDPLAGIVVAEHAASP
jgi:hypothetical protein